ncbi:MAG: M90 family metallopeptidase [Pseudomonadota bacterium]
MELSPAMFGALPILLVVGIFLVSFYYRRWRRRQIVEAVFPDTWRAILRERVSVYASLPEPQRTKLEQLIKLFLDDKTFYGCAGLTVTDVMKVCIAAEACLLLLGQSGPVYPKLQSVLVYPTAFRAQHDQHQEDGTVAQADHHLLGESWGNGKVILSWDDVEEGARDFSDGHNVVLHEFAHQLDSASGTANGAPYLRNNSYHTWAKVFSDNFEDLRSRVSSGKSTVMDAYGATNPAEFFAVATETFFEKPGDLQKRRPELFDELQQYYRLDPREWQR